MMAEMVETSFETVKHKHKNTHTRAHRRFRHMAAQDTQSDAIKSEVTESSPLRTVTSTSIHYFTSSKTSNFKAVLNN
jgi:hypothetical protein